LRLLSGTTEELAVRARDGLDALMQKPEYVNATEAKKTAMLRDWLTKKGGAPNVVSPPPGTFNPPAPTITGPTEVPGFQFQYGKADALRYDVKIGTKTVPVYMPKNPGAATIHAKEQVAHGLASLPASSLALVSEVRVNDKPNTKDPYWKKKYNDPTFTSYMTAGAAGTIDIYPVLQTQDYLDGTMIHETGHTLSRRLWGESDESKGWKAWAAAAKKDVLVPSQYARKSPGEDFGETLQLYMQVKGTEKEAEIRALMPARFKILDDVLSKPPPKKGK
jgi:hypothetical protein